MAYSTARPPYVGPSWLKHTTGFKFASPPPRHLASDATLSSPNLWERIVCVTLQAQAGDFRNVPRLIETAHLTKDPYVGPAAVRVFCHSAPRTAVLELGSIFSHPDYDTRLESYTSAPFACTVSLVEALLEAMPSRGGDEPDFVAAAVTDILDPKQDEGAELIELLEDIPAFTEMARRMLAERIAQFGTETAIFNGMPFDLRRLTDRIRELVRREDHVDMGGEIAELLSIFEATTGISCEGCSTSDVAPITPKITSILNRFEFSGQVDSFKPGRRYFFWHEIPAGQTLNSTW